MARVPFAKKGYLQFMY